MPREGDHYKRFKAYLELGPGRTVAEVAQRVGISPNRLRDIALTWRWRERAEARDLERERCEDAQARAVDRKRRAEMAEMLHTTAMRFGAAAQGLNLRDVPAGVLVRGAAEAARTYDTLMRGAGPVVQVEARASASASASAAAGSVLQMGVATPEAVAELSEDQAVVLARAAAEELVRRSGGGA
ncbi:hypothetical protein EDD38_7685 [Kitasatospora cineracea]|uniref:Uncharacterized protein n=2 Tax=Kitasatospora cineracea TaxID=88074 RepID=A0A3N4QZ87_9ACTN|nr:hypothetical protein EDD38_7685 [Kitasatospora cineracea]